MVKIFIVGLDKDYRGQVLEAKLKSFGLELTRIHGVDLRNKPVHELALNQDLIRLWNGRMITSGEIGCENSHRLAWTLALKSKTEWHIILEDDAVIDESFVDFVKYIDAINIKGAAIISGHWPFAIARRPFSRIIPAKNHQEIRKVVTPPYSTVCYAINLAAIRNHLEMSRLRITTADWPISTFLVDFYVYMNQAALHPEGQSTLQLDRRIEQQRNFFNSNASVPTESQRLLSLVRRLWLLHGQLRLNQFPKPTSILVRKAIATLYFIQILKTIPGLEVLPGTKIPLDQRRIELKELINLIKESLILLKKSIYRN